MEILAVKDLKFSYPACTDTALNGLSFALERGEFAVLCGATGSGKSTLLRMLKRELSPLGTKSGDIIYNGTPIDKLNDKVSASEIGFVMQDPEQQIVTDKVWHELAFGLENLGVPPTDIARRVAEMASYFGIGAWYDKNISQLSGGQKQLLNLAAILVMHPELLILDEPTAQLDPIAAADFIATIKRLNQDLGITIIIAEHRLEDVIPVCDRLLVVEKGSLIANGRPENVISDISKRKDIMYGMPAAARLYTALGGNSRSPLTVREGRDYITTNYNNEKRTLTKEIVSNNANIALSFMDVYFRYDRNSSDILNGLSLDIKKGEIFSILGGNGSGKTTSVSAAAGILKPYSGTIKVFGKKLKEYKNRSLYKECLALLPQDVTTVFLRNTVREELKDAGASANDLPYDISHLMDKHPYDLSGGEKQLVALAKVLASKPKLLLLDEPTKGMDAAVKQNIIHILSELRNKGMTLVIVTHDVEFAAACADRCAMFFGGKIVSAGTPDSFFSQNSFYTTAISRMTRGFYDNAVTLSDAVELCRINGKKEAQNDSH